MVTINTGSLNSIGIEDIHKVCTELGMTIFNQPYSLTMGAIRAHDRYANTFNDLIFGSYPDESGKIHSVIFPGTVDAGLTYRLKPVNKNGTAIIQHSFQYKGVYQLQDPELNPKQHGHKGKIAFVQIKDMKYWRDSNKDNKLDFEGKTYTENAKTNGHMMGTLGESVNNWSAGCWGAIENSMKKLFDMGNIQIAHGLGDKFSFIMLHQKDFK